MAKTNIGLRKKIIRLYKKHGDYNKVAELTQCSYYQVWNAVNGRVKNDYSSRTDKGKMRKTDKPVQNDGDDIDLKIKMRSPDEFNSPAEFMEHQCMVALHDLSVRKYTADQRVKILKDISALQKNIQLQKLESWIKQPEAKLVMNIMKRLASKLSDDELLKIYTEELEKLKRNLAS